MDVKVVNNFNSTTNDINNAIHYNTSFYNPNNYNFFFNPRDPINRNLLVDTDKLEVHSQYWESITLIPILATLMLAVTVFLLVLFRQTPTFVACTVAATLTVIGVYLVLSGISENKLKFE